MYRFGFIIYVESCYRHLYIGYIYHRHVTFFFFDVTQAINPQNGKGDVRLKRQLRTVVCGMGGFHDKY